jgi:hypothetical protein
VACLELVALLVLLGSCVVLMLLGAKVSIRQNSFLADAVSHEHLQQMIRNFIKFIDTFDMSSNDRLFFLKDSNGAVDFDIDQITKTN